jgi:release factor glutamine methyltransferase
VDQPTWTIQRLLEWTTPFFTRKGVDSPRLSGELLLAHVLNVPRIKLYTDYQRIVAAEDLARFRSLVQRAAEAEPVAYLTGRAGFFNLELDVTSDVLIPRPDTEVLVENVIRLARTQPGLERPRVLDLCTGSGCVALAIAANIKDSLITAVEISHPAAKIARQNAARLKLTERVNILEGDLYAALVSPEDRRSFDIIVANPPYIATAKIETLDRCVRDYEPRSALDGGPDGLAIHRRILAGAAERLNAGGHVLLEIAFDQGPSALDLPKQHSELANARLLKDYAGNDRVLIVNKAN